MIDLPFFCHDFQKFIRGWMLESLTSFHFTFSLQEGSPKTELKTEYGGMSPTEAVCMCIIDSYPYQQGANEIFTFSLWSPESLKIHYQTLKYLDRDS